ncbi:hypothetical protein DEJ44_15235 [Streptomyces venezuelae]|uniref:hypothetical protein n=1 Tax=Streptomyces venezuelae TaxID=54571 RepID=UPI0012393A3F|nr:hypothetical protein [Streptomyces venezuelae]QES06826.1 hypothetical protein DEJ44_15235 [Streptomyces venezuelae]
MRLRIRPITWPRPALVLADTPRPGCPRCGGEGGRAYDYGDHETGEYAGTEWDPCPCWNEDRSWVLLPLPRFPRRRQPHVDPWGNGHSDEPPF